MVMTQATTAVANTVPGGSAIGIGMTYSMLGSWGYSRSRTTTAVLVSGVWNSFIKLGMPVLPWPWSHSRAAPPGAGCRRPARHRRAGGRDRGVRAHAAQRGAGAPVRAAGRARTIGLVEHRWVPITVTSLVSHLSLYVVLLVALRDVGVSDTEVGWAEVLAVFAFARLATAIPLTPGGVGFVEGVLVTGLVGAGGDPDEVAAAVVVYRALTWALPILVGIGCYLWWRRQTWTPPVQDAQLPAKAKRP